MLAIKNALVLRGKNLSPEKADLLLDSYGITDIGKDIDDSNCDIIDAQGHIVLPAFNNAHVHIGDSIAKDIGDGKSLDEIVKPPDGLKHKILEESSDDDIIEFMKYSMYEMLKNGISSFIDYREGGLDGVKLLKKASEDIPIKAIILSRDDIFYDSDASSKKIKNTCKKLLKHSDGIGLSGFGEISHDNAKVIATECNKRGKISSIHVAEHKKVQVDSLKKTGKTEIERAIDSNFKQIVHLTHPYADDLEKLAIINKNEERTISPVLCPRSNGVLSAGIPPISELINKDTNPLLGTDNIMFNSPDMFREMEYTLKVSRAITNSYVSPLEILKMATTNFNNSISIGSKVDLLIIKQKSKNPYLSLINRSNKDDIKKLVINKN